LDALLSIAQMPKGVPVATVGVNNGANAALLAVRILAITRPKLRQKLARFIRGQKAKVKNANSRLKTRPKSRA
jgi:5-(carboxyamino)imidazole ribonucleotide mutase